MSERGAETGVGAAPRPWWETRPYVAALILLSMVPLLYPPIPPLVDLLGHMGRYRVQLDGGSSPWLGLYYGYEWKMIGNLGVELLIEPVSRLAGLETGVKLIVITIPAIMTAGFLWVAREVHHRLPPTAALAVPFAYSHPFLYGFVNFALAMALAFLAFGLWLRLARLGRLRLRAILFVPISFIVFFAHTFGWGTLGLLCFSAEAVRQHDRGIGWIKAGWKAAGHAIVMALPALVILAWRARVNGEASDEWFVWQYKWQAILAVLRDRWILFDWLSVAAVTGVIAFAIFSRRMTLSRNLAFSALVLAAMFAILPWKIFGSAHADMRLAPFVFAVAILAVRFRADTHLPTARRLAVLAVAFMLVRLAANTMSFATAADDQRAKLAALDHVPMGAKVVSLVGRACGTEWAMARNSHIGAMTIVRRHGFSNDQWLQEGLNPLLLRYGDARLFSADPSQIVRPSDCANRPWRIDLALIALNRLPPGTIDYLWMVTPPPFDPRQVEGMELVWQGSDSLLLRLPGASPGADQSGRTSTQP